MFESVKIYCDMDGVLADFDKRYDEIVGGIDKRPPDVDGQFWKPIIDTPDFWLSLDWMPGGKLLWSYLQKFEHLCVLSSPGTHDTGRAKEHKRLWLHEMIGKDVNAVFKQAKLKHMYACPKSVLIDDWEPTIKRWTRAGGIAIHHKSAEDTIEKLISLGL